MLSELGIVGLTTGACVGIDFLHKRQDERIRNMKLSDYELILGYELGYRSKVPIICDMRHAAHLLVCGLSGSGKTKQIEYALRDKQVILLNAFEEDFSTLSCIERANDPYEMKTILDQLTETKERFDRPVYLVLDEILELSLSGDKVVSSLIMRLLATARHRNIFLVGITQSAEKEILKFKSLFSNRVCFRMIEDSQYRTVLGYTPETTELMQRQFHYFTNTKGLGGTFDV